MRSQSREQSDTFTPSTSSILTYVKRFLPLVLFFALTYGLLEAAGYMYFSSLKGQIPWELRWIGVSEEIILIAPLVALALFSMATLGLFFLAFLFRRKVGEIEVVILLVWMSVFGLINLPGSLQILSTILLASGISTVAWNLLKPRVHTFISLVQKALPVMVAMILILSFAVTYGKSIREKIKISNLAEAKPGSPNILLVVLDTLRADHLSAYGYERETTPNIDRLAKEGVLFEHAYSNSSWTVPSHASLFTGQPVFKHQADGDNPLDETYPTLAEELAKSGYRTAGFVANTYWAGRKSGFSRGFIHYQDYFSSASDMFSRTVYGRLAREYLLPILGYNNVMGRKSAEDVNGEFFRWLNDTNTQPFFAFLNYMDVHDPYIPPPGYKTVFSNDTKSGELVNFVQNEFFINEELNAQEVKGAIDAYDSSLLYLDSQIGALLDELENRGLAENTWIIIVSDHGESFGEKRLWGHGNSLYLEVLHVPMIWWYPKKFTGDRRVTEAVGLNSLPATIQTVVNEGSPEPFPEPDLLGVLDASPDELAPILSEKSQNIYGPDSWPVKHGWLDSLVTERWHLIQSETGKVELYDLQADPQEQHNLAGTSDGKEVIQRLTPYFSERP